MLSPFCRGVLSTKHQDPGSSKGFWNPGSKPPYPRTPLDRVHVGQLVKFDSRPGYAAMIICILLLSSSQLGYMSSPRERSVEKFGAFNVSRRHRRRLERASYNQFLWFRGRLPPEKKCSMSLYPVLFLPLPRWTFPPSSPHRLCRFQSGSTPYPRVEGGFFFFSLDPSPVKASFLFLPKEKVE